MDVRDAMSSRKTIRAFLPTKVSLDVVLSILDQARRAPSGGNIQPWRVYLALGEALEGFLARIRAERALNPRGETPEYHIYPPSLAQPYAGRTSAIGELMYGSMKITREDKAARLKFFSGNYEFFGAPIALFFTIDRVMQQGQ